MRFVIDLDSLEVIESATDRRKVSQVEGKRGDDSPFEVIFVRTGVAEELAGSTVLTFGAKKEGKYDAAAVVLENGFTLSGSGTTAVYSGNPSFNTAALNALFLIDANDANDPPYVDLMAEFTWQVGAGAPTSTKTFRFRVHNDVVRDDEVSPTPAYSPIGIGAPVNVATAIGSLELNPGFYTEVAALATFTIGDTVITEGNELNGHPYSGNGSLVDDLVYYINTVAPNDFAVIASKIDSDNIEFIAKAEGTAGNGIVIATNVGTEGVDYTANDTAGGVDATVAPPYIRVNTNQMFIQDENGAWKAVTIASF
jgi:hypothetical protein